MADWYPRNRPALRAWAFNLKLKRPDYELKYGILKSNDTLIDADLDWLIWWCDTMNVMDERSQQMSGFFNDIAGSDPSVDPPQTPIFTAPPGMPTVVPPGIQFRLREVRREVVNYSNYSKADGDDLGFEASSGGIDPLTVKPSVNIFGAETGFMFSAVVTGRAESDQWQVSVAEVGTTNWKVVGTFTGKSADITYTDGTDKPVQLQVRIQLRKGNANYGQPSDIVLVTVNP